MDPAPAPTPPAPLPDGWTLSRTADGFRLLEAATGLYLEVVLQEVVAVEPAWTDGPEELASLCAALCWLRDTLGDASPSEAFELLRVADGGQS